MMFTKIEYLSSEIMGPPEALLIDIKGAASYESHTNLSQKGASAVGTYATTLDVSEMKALADALANPSFRDLPDHWGQIAVGESYKVIRVTEASETVEKRIGRRLPVDPRMQSLLGRLDQIVMKVRDHPVSNLQLLMSHVRIEPDGTFAGTITLKNPGTASVACANPAVFREKRGGRLSLRGWPDREPSEIHSTDIFEADVIDVQREGLAGKPTSELLEISAGAGVSFRIKAPGPKTDGKEYVIQLLYQNTAANREGREVMIVELYSPQVKLK